MEISSTVRPTGRLSAPWLTRAVGSRTFAPAGRAADRRPGQGCPRRGVRAGLRVLTLIRSLNGLNWRAVSAPAQWASDNEAVLDWARWGRRWSMTCPGLGKSGVGYVLDATQLGGVGGQLAAQRICAACGGSAGRRVDRVLAVQRRDPSASIDAGGVITSRWTATVPANGPQIVGRGAVWVTDYLELPAGEGVHLSGGGGRNIGPTEDNATILVLLNPSGLDLSGNFPRIGLTRRMTVSYT